MTKFTVEIVEGKDLIAADSDGLSDPFVNVRLISEPKKKFRTNVYRKSLNPHWNETFEFHFDTLADTLEFHVWDKDTFKNDFLGAAFLSLGSCKIGENAEHWLPLERVQSGSILVRVTLPAGEHDTQSLTISKDEVVFKPHEMAASLILPQFHVNEEHSYKIKQTQTAFPSSHCMFIYNEEGKELFRITGNFPIQMGVIHYRYTVEIDGVIVMTVVPSLMGAELFSAPDNENKEILLGRVLFTLELFKQGCAFERDGEIVLKQRYGFFSRKEKIVNGNGENVAHCVTTWNFMNPPAYTVKCAKGTDHMLTILYLCVSEIAVFFFRASRSRHGSSHHAHAHHAHHAHLHHGDAHHAHMHHAQAHHHL
jgi:hypothetical protein